MTPTNIFVDTSWFKAFADPHDDFHQQAIIQFSKLKEANTKLITTNYILDETFTLIRAKVGLSSALDFRQMLVELRVILKIIRVIDQDDTKAWDWFLQDWSKLSFTDCVSFAVMKRIGLSTAVTFDDHFHRAGFIIF